MALCLITCNIRFDNPADGHHAWPHRRDFLAQTLLKHNPDIIATQEGRYQQLKDFGSNLKNYELIDEHRSWISERMYPSFFIRKDRFEILKSEDIWLSETPNIAASRSFGSAFPRLMTWLKIRPKNSDKNILIVNTHLDHLKEETRIGQINVLIQEINKIWQSECPLVLMGDFNESPIGQVRQIINKEFPDLQDAWKSFNNIEETSHHAFKGKMDNGTRIDWILVDKNAKIQSCIMDKTNKEGLYPTDHYPIISKIKF